MRLLIVWMMAGIAERETVRQAMRQMTTTRDPVATAAGHMSCEKYS
jgi:hypothetical protein